MSWHITDDYHPTKDIDKDRDQGRMVRVESFTDTGCRMYHDKHEGIWYAAIATSLRKTAVIGIATPWRSCLDLEPASRALVF